MAYSDYGGFAYRNGAHEIDRSDAVLSPSGIKSTPGMWPGWVLEEGRSGGSYHVILGDGPIFVTLYKQSGLGVHRLGEALDVTTLIVDPREGDIESYNGRNYINTAAFKDGKRACLLRVDDHEIEVHWLEEDNHYQYCRLKQPDGTVWTGWSGYGVGAGFEDGDYGYSNGDRDDTLEMLFAA